MTKALPPPWEALEDHCEVSHCAVLVGGRQPRTARLIEHWLELSDSVMTRVAELGIVVPKARLIRVDGKSERVEQKANTRSSRIAQAAALLRAGRQGTLDLAGDLSGSMPQQRFIHAWESSVILHPPDWMTFELRVTIGNRLTVEERSALTELLAELLHDISGDSHVDYAEAAGRAAQAYNSQWEAGLDPDLHGGPGVQLAPRWLRGLGAITYLAPTLVTAVGGRQKLETLAEPHRLEPCGEGLLLWLYDDLWSEDSRRLDKLQRQLADNLVTTELLSAAEHFAVYEQNADGVAAGLEFIADGKAWHGPNAVDPDEVLERILVLAHRHNS